MRWYVIDDKVGIDVLEVICGKFMVGDAEWVGR